MDPQARAQAGEPLQAPRPRRKTVIKDVVVTVALPWLIFFLIVCLFLFTYHDLAFLVWVIITLCTVLALLFLVLGISVRNRTFIAIGLLCLASVNISTTVGLWLTDSYLEQWYKLDYSGEGFGIDPTRGDINASADDSLPSVIHFLNGTFVDDKRTLGYLKEGDIWCVAPVSLPGFEDAKVSYWAAGRNCCEQRSGFDCGIARDPKANVAIATESRIYGEKAHFTRAVKMAEVIHEVSSTEHYRLVSFVSSPESVMSDLWDECVTIALAVSLLDLMMCLIAGAVLAKILITKPQASQNKAPFAGG